MAKHINNVIYENGVRLFCKEFLSRDWLLKEFQGYQEVSKYYPVSKLINGETCLTEGRMIFEYENSIATNKGLLVDIFNGTESRDALGEIFVMFASIFSQTVEMSQAKAADVFFEDRVPNLRKRYADQFKSGNIPGFVFNGFPISLNLLKVIESVECYFKIRRGTEFWSIISQADPTDLNIGIKPIIFDYLGGGRVPLMAEFANIVWEQLALSPLLGPTYNPRNYTDHDLSFKNALTVKLRDDGIHFSPLAERLLFLDEYIRIVIMPIIDKIDYVEWYDDFKNHIAMRILGVFDVTDFSAEHRLLAFGYLDLFYNAWNTKSPSEIVEAIRKHGNSQDKIS